MPRTLHIIDQRTPQDCLYQLGMLARPDDAIASVGPPPHAPALDLPVRAVHAPMGSAALAGRRREIKALAREADVIHAWSPRAAAAAVMAANGRVILLTLPHALGANRMPSTPASSAGHSMRVTVPTEAALRALTAAGGDKEALDVLRPPARPLDGAAAASARNRVRKALSLNENECLIAAPGEMTPASGHKYASWAYAIVRKYLDGPRLIMPCGGARFENVKSFVISTGYSAGQHMTGREFALADVLAAADMAVFFHEQDCGVSALAAAMAMGLPIAASHTPDVAECAQDAAALLVPPRDPRAGAAAVTKLITDRNLSKRLGTAAKERAEELFDPERCRAKLDEIYAEIRRRGRSQQEHAKAHS